MRNRCYNPYYGRFYSEDPVWSTNLFPYADNNPIMNIDPNGEYLETAADVASFAYDLNEYRKNPSIANGIYLGLDVITTGLPLVAGGGVTARTIIKQSDKAIYEVYHLVNTFTGKIEYVGITSKGYLNRFEQHLFDPSKQDWIHNVEPKLLKKNLKKLDARILEQKEILKYGLTNLKNKINSISPKFWSKFGIK